MEATTMRRYTKTAALFILAAMTVLTGCTQEAGESGVKTGGEAAVAGAGRAMALCVKWQRLVDESGQTCGRCGLTGTEVRKAIDLLTEALEPLNIDVFLNEVSLSPAECADDISQSNRIWIAGVSLEEWLGARVGASVCEGCCEYMKGCVETERQTVDCRTLVIGTQVYEAIPAELVLKAGLLAAAELVLPEQASSCCPGGGCSEPCKPGVFNR
jgi:hypothetical protein